MSRIYEFVDHGNYDFRFLTHTEFLIQNILREVKATFDPFSFHIFHLLFLFRDSSVVCGTRVALAVVFQG